MSASLTIDRPGSYPTPRLGFEYLEDMRIFFSTYLTEFSLRQYRFRIGRSYWPACSTA